MKQKRNLFLMNCFLNRIPEKHWLNNMLMILLLFFLTLPVSLLAQKSERTITGKVSAEDGMPIPAATVFLEGTSRGTVTDVSGNYSITVSASQQKLVFSFMGMQSQTVVVGTQKVINITLKESTVQLDEVVAIGYGTVKKSDLTGSVASVKSQDIAASGAVNVEQALRGRSAGVVINAADNAPGAGLTIQIRGASSINASSAPLYVIDGFPVEGAYSSGGNQTLTNQSPLSSIDPNDIESIDILKDASATAVYGARGANGVVIITTKSGKDGKTKVSFNANYGISKMDDKYQVADTKFFAQAQHDRYFLFDKRIIPPVSGAYGYAWWDVTPYSSPDTTSTNWMKEITQLGRMQNYNISLSGGNNKGDYMASLAYFNNEGVIKRTDVTRYTGSFKANGSPKPWLRLSFTTAFSNTENNGTVTVNAVDGAGGGAGILTQVVKTSPMMKPNEKTLSASDADLNLIIGSPLEVLDNVKMKREVMESRTNFSATILPFKGLSIRSMIGMSKNKTDFKSYAPSTTSWGSNYNGRAVIQSNNYSSLLNENTVTYDKKFGKHKINVLGGLSQQYNSRFNTSMESTNFPVEALGYNNISVGQNPITPISFADEFLLLSYFGRVNYNYAEKYLFTASYRADGSSKFAQNNKWGYFPSFAFAWRAGEEPFIKPLKFINNLKFRAGYGETGNPNIPPYQSLTNYGLTKYPSGTAFGTGTYPINVGNPNLKWETSVQSNVGLDLSIFNSRLSFVIDAYLKQTKDLLLNGDIPASTGFSSYLYNAGSIENRGIEIAINSIILDNSIKWTADFNIAFNKNKVTSLGDLVSQNWMIVPGCSNWNTAMLQVGKPVGLWYGYQTDGLWQQTDFDWNNATNKWMLKAGSDGKLPAALSTAQPGLWKFKDISGKGIPDGKIDAFDKGVIGTSQPKFTGGLNNRFEYKNFDLTLFFEWSVGRDIYNANIRNFTGNQTGSQNSIVFDYWKPIQYALDASGKETSTILAPGNIHAKYPLTDSPLIDMHDGYMEDGSYLRIKNLSLGYTFKSAVLKKLDLGSLRVYANLLNLFTFTKYSGYDPNVNAQDLNGLRPGYDLNSYPSSKTIMLGLSANF